MAQLYPPIEPFVQHSLTVDARHTLHVEQCGNPKGIPVLFVHGGPGAGCEPYHRRFFDPERYHIILFDQRGCGRSLPHADLTDNTTAHLVADMEAIRTRLGIERWVLFGGSWGSTLSLVYAETHPERVLSLILRGIFLCRPKDIDWFYQFGASELLPDRWRDYIAPIPAEERDDLVRAYHRRLTGDDEVARMAAAKAWSLWEARSATLKPNPGLENYFGEPYTALALARIENHYFANDSFLEPEQILRNARAIADIPGYIVHGRYDLVCPLENAWALHQVWPLAKFTISPEAGHSAAEPGNLAALVEATDETADRLWRG
ncbi:MAG: prolyl aminopeptidase [Chromatiales bacterium]|nr:prolyl aminopeptidase [Chromatiales bacterium]